MTPQDAIQNEYEALKQSGMFWEFFPELSGEWTRDKDAYTKFYEAREERKKSKA